MVLSFIRKLNMSPGQRDTGDVIDADDINELQAAFEGVHNDPLGDASGTLPAVLTDLRASADGIQDGTLPIALAGIEDALGGVGGIASSRLYQSLALALSANASGVLVIADSQEVPAGTVIPANTRVIVSPGVVLTRAVSSGAWITLGAGSILEGGEYDGRKAASGMGNAKADVAITVGVNAIFRDAFVHDAGGHGVKLGAGAFADNVISSDNGITPGGFGTGDGIYATDVLGCRFANCSTTGNARMGITVTSNSAPASATLDNCSSTGNGYADYDLEGTGSGNVVDVTARGLKGGTLSLTCGSFVIAGFRGSNMYSGPTYAADTDVVLSDIVIDGTGDPLELFCNRVRINGFTVNNDRDSGYSASISVNLLGVIENAIVSGSVYNGLKLNTIALSSGVWSLVRNVTTDLVASNRYFYLQPRSDRGVVYGDNATIWEVKDGLVTMRGTSAPGSGDWVAGDAVINTAPSAGGAYQWVCVTGGAPGTWKAVEIGA